MQTETNWLTSTPESGDRRGYRHSGNAYHAPQLSVMVDAVGTQAAVQQKLMRHADIRTTMNVYGDIVTDENGCEWQSRRVSAQRITGMNLKWCCSELEARVNQGGKAGFGILAAINKRGLLCFLEFRHADSTGASDFPEGGVPLKVGP